MREELLKGLSEEQIARLKDCKNQEEILKAAKEEGLELTDEQLEAASGGSACGDGTKCPKCGSEDTEIIDENFYCNPIYKCNSCGCTWTDRSKTVK